MRWMVKALLFGLPFWQVLPLAGAPARGWWSKPR